MCVHVCIQYTCPLFLRVHGSVADTVKKFSVVTAAGSPEIKRKPRSKKSELTGETDAPATPKSKEKTASTLTAFKHSMKGTYSKFQRSSVFMHM